MPVIRIKSTHPESQGPFVIIEAEDFDPAVHLIYDDGAESTPAQTSPSGFVEIPADWVALHWKKQVALAEKIAGRSDVDTAAAAREIIEAEVKRRAEAQA